MPLPPAPTPLTQDEANAVVAVQLQQYNRLMAAGVAPCNVQGSATPEWRNEFSGYFTQNWRDGSYNLEPISNGTLYSTACSAYQANRFGSAIGTLCFKQLYNERGDKVPAPQICGGTGPNRYLYSPVDQALENNADKLKSLADDYKEKEDATVKSIATYWVAAIVIVAVLIILAILF